MNLIMPRVLKNINLVMVMPGPFAIANGQSGLVQVSVLFLGVDFILIFTFAKRPYRFSTKWCLEFF